MIIEEKLFKLEVGGQPDRFDLYLLKGVKTKGEKENIRYEFKLHGYDMYLENALRVIIDYLIQHKVGEQSISLKQYLKLYKNISSSIKNLFIEEVKNVITEKDKVSDKKQS